MWRKRLCPKTLVDGASVLVMVVMIPIVYWFEVFVVLPIYFVEQRTFYIIHCIIATYLLINVVGNYVGVYVIDTSIEGRFLTSEIKPKWKFCDICECVTPPRSWHCNVCNTCILKRDHHCLFTSCCIGHFNQRYFMMFLFYFTISTIYCTYFNAYYIWNFTTFSWLELTKFVLPLAAVVFGNDLYPIQLYRLICVLIIVGMLIVGVILYVHMVNIRVGVVMHEKQKGIKDYDLGTTKENIRQVFGNRWYLTIVSPFIHSELPCDGIHWDGIKQLTNKSK